MNKTQILKRAFPVERVEMLKMLFCSAWHCIMDASFTLIKNSWENSSLKATVCDRRGVVIPWSGHYEESA